MSAFEQDQRYVGLCAAEHLGYLSLRHGSAKPSDLCHFFGGQKLLEECDSANIDGVLFIPSVVGPLKIGDDIVRFHPIDVVDHGEVVGVGDECEPNKPMNMDGLALSVSIEIDSPISEFVGAWAKDLSIYPSCLQAMTNAVKTTNAAEIADFVEITEVSDLNRSPFFRKSDIHMTGCPSGNGGLAIKDPSRASTFGGSAVITSASDNFNRRLRFL
jgi:hypothetical protein